MPLEQPVQSQPAVAQTQPIPSPHPALQQPPTAERPIEMDQATFHAWETERLELLKFKHETQKQLEAKEVERLAALAKAGKIEEALAETRNQGEVKHREAEQRYQALETAWLTEKKTAAIAEALNGRPFVGPDPAKTASILRRLLADEIEASRDSQGNPIVYDRTTRRPAADYLKERLESPEFGMFFMPMQRGGAGTDGTRTQANQAATEDPTSAYMREYRERMAANLNRTAPALNR